MIVGNQVNLEPSESSIPAVKRPSSSPIQSWAKSVFNSYEEAFVDFRQFLNLLYAEEKYTVERDDMNWQVVCSAFNNLRNQRWWNLNSSSVWSRVLIIGMCQSLAVYIRSFQ